MRARSWLGLLGVMVLSACGSAGGGAGGSGSPIAVDPFDPGQGGYGYGGGSYGGGDSGPGAPPVPTTSDEPPPEAPLGCEELDPEIALVLYLSADDSNSMATPARARELLRDGIFPHGLGARPYEFLNYYDVAYPAPPTGQLGLHAVASPGSSPETYELQLAVRAFDALPERRPMTLTFVLDASGSMEGEPLNRERAAVLAIASQLREGDIVNMVTWDTTNNVVLAGHAVEGPSDATLVEAAQGLSASGGTDLEGGLAMGYQLATQHYGPARLNRVILISDGGANVGVTSAELIAQHSADGDEESIYLVGVGAGRAEIYDDKLMDEVTDQGRGAYVYLDSEDAAYEMFGARFDETMEIAAREVSVEVTLPWYFKMREFYGEEYSTDPELVDPQHLAPGDVMVFQQVLEACDASVVSPDDVVGLKVKWKTPLAHLDDSTELEVSLGELLEADQAPMRKARAIIAYARALQGELMVYEALALVSEALADGSDADLEEIQSLLEPFVEPIVDPTAEPTAEP